jgi:hypothetical protein
MKASRRHGHNAGDIIAFSSRDGRRCVPSTHFVPGEGLAGVAPGQSCAQRVPR